MKKKMMHATISRSMSQQMNLIHAKIAICIENIMVPQDPIPITEVKNKMCCNNKFKLKLNNSFHIE